MSEFLQKSSNQIEAEESFPCDVHEKSLWMCLSRSTSINLTSAALSGIVVNNEHYGDRSTSAYIWDVSNISFIADARYGSSHTST